MIYKFELFDAYKPKQKCGSVALGAFGLGSSLLGFFSQQSTNASSLGFSKAENQRNRDFSAREAEKQRNWQHDEFNYQFDRQYSAWNDMFSKEQQAQWDMFLKQAEYNSPKNQVDRLAQAGINPSAAMNSSGGSGLMSAATGNVANMPQPSVPSGGAVSGASASAPSNAGVNLQAPQLDLSSLGSFIENIGKAYKENKMMRPQLDMVLKQIDNIVADTTSKELLNSWQSITNDILSETKDKQVESICTDVLKKYAEVRLLEAQGTLVNEQVVTETLNQFLKDMEGKISEQQYLKLVFEVAHIQETWSAEIKLKRSQAFQAATQGNLNIALKKTENQLREWRVSNEKAISSYNWHMDKLASVDWKIANRTEEMQIKVAANKLVNELQQDDFLTETLYWQLEKLMQENDWYGFNQIMGAITGSIQSGAIMYGVGRMARGAAPIKGFAR